MTDIPKDYQYPNWKKINKCHDWKNYVSDDLKEIWSTFYSQQRMLLAENFQSMADKEEWE